MKSKPSLKEYIAFFILTGYALYALYSAIKTVIDHQ